MNIYQLLGPEAAKLADHIRDTVGVDRSVLYEMERCKNREELLVYLEKYRGRLNSPVYNVLLHMLKRAS